MTLSGNTDGAGHRPRRADGVQRPPQRGHRLQARAAGRALPEAVRQRARLAIIDSSTIAYLGEIAPGAPTQTVGITNALDVLQVSPTDNALELS